MNLKLCDEDLTWVKKKVPPVLCLKFEANTFWKKGMEIELTLPFVYIPGGT